MQNFQPKINDILLISNYPNFVNDRFNNLVIPHGLFSNQYYEPSKYNYTICNNNECIEELIYDKLIELVEVSPKLHTDNTKKHISTKKHKQHKQHKKPSKKNTKKAKST